VRKLAMPRKTHALSLIFPLVLAACQIPPSDSAVGAPQRAARYGVDERASEVRLLMYRDGPLARFGHNHVVVGRVQGEIRAGDSAAASGFRLEIPVESFAVDPPEARAEEGEAFAAPVPEPARRDTREDMLGSRMLDAANHPLIRIESIALVGPDWAPTVIARVTVRDAARDLRFDASVFRQDDVLTAVASFWIDQSALGIKPFTTPDGGLRVRDALFIRLRIIARRGK
jgi:polyisoprenoid-binding protein YceI